MENEPTRPDTMEQPVKSCSALPSTQGVCGWRLPLLLCLVLCGIIFYGLSSGRVNNDHQRKTTEETTEETKFSPPSRMVPGAPSSQASGKTVGLAIDYGNGAHRQFEALPWRAEMTIAELMTDAMAFRPGITFTQRGTGKMAFLTSIDGIASQTASQALGAAQGWQYKINGEHGRQSFGGQILSPGDQVLWIYGPGQTEY